MSEQVQEGVMRETVVQGAWVYLVGGHPARRKTTCLAANFKSKLNRKLLECHLNFFVTENITHANRFKALRAQKESSSHPSLSRDKDLCPAFRQHTGMCALLLLARWEGARVPRYLSFSPPSHSMETILHTLCTPAQFCLTVSPCYVV